MTAHMSWHRIAMLMVFAILWSATGCETNKDVDSDESVDVASPMRTMHLAPTSAVIQTSETIDFTVHGGSPPYWWRLSDGAVGTISSHSHTAIYTPLEIGGNIIIVTDRRGNSASAAIHARD